MDVLERAFAYVDEHREEYLKDLGEICSFPSTAAHAEALENTRTWIEKRLERAGVSAKRVGGGEGNDMIAAQKNGTKDKTVLFYNHYDVVEPGDPQKWDGGDPYRVRIENGRMYARGISDNKGPLVSRIQAVEALLAVSGELPVNVKFFFEGDEETSSPSMVRYQNMHMEEFQEHTKADVCFWENGRHDQEGNPWSRFGVRGACAFNLKVTTAATDVHGRMGATVPSDSWRLIWALSTLKSSDEKVQIEGFYDDVIPPTQEELEFLKKFPYDEEKQKQKLGLKQFVLGASGEELKKRVYLEPTLSVCGLEAGELYNGPRGIVPHTAWARISMYLVADQNPDKIAGQLRKHLDKNGFEDVEVEYLGGTWPVKTSLKTPAADVLDKASELVYHKPMMRELTQLGSGPAIVFRNAWPELPLIGVGPGNTASNHHAPNENLAIEDYFNSLKCMIAFLYEWGKE